MEKSQKTLFFAFIGVLLIAVIISAIGIMTMKHKPDILQGQIEATEIRISGKLPGRIDTFLVKEGESVSMGQPLVRIHAPEAVAKYMQVSAMEDVARYQNQKIDAGTRRQIIESAYQVWEQSKASPNLDTTTYHRITRRDNDRVVTSQRKDEVEAV